MKIITVATHSQGYFQVLKQSCRRNNIELTILGWGQKWGGFGWKLKVVRDYLKTLPADDIVLVIDAFDTLIICDTDEILAKFKSMNKPMLCAAERPHDRGIWNAAYERIFNNKGTYPKTPTAYCYLNAGVWLSSAGYALKLLTKAAIENSTNDQTYFTYLYLRGEVFIDFNCEIFTCIRKERDLKQCGTRFENAFTYTYPCIIHAPADVTMENIVASICYEPVRYGIFQKSWKYIYSIRAFWGDTSFKKMDSNLELDGFSANRFGAYDEKRKCATK
jgi:hypothetical protein